MSTNKKIQEIITRLIRLTDDGQIDWEIEDPPRAITDGSDTNIPLFFVTELLDSRIAIYQERYPQYYGDLNDIYWDTRLALAILDNENREVWNYTGDLQSLYDLFNRIREQKADLDKLIDLLTFREND